MGSSKERDLESNSDGKLLEIKFKYEKNGGEIELEVKFNLFFVLSEIDQFLR